MCPPDCDSVNRKIRILWYVPGFILGSSHPTSIGTLALSKALARHNEFSYVVIASDCLKTNTRLSDKLELISISQNPLFAFRELTKVIVSKRINLIQERLGCYYLSSDWGILAGNYMGLPTVGLIHEYPVALLSRMLSKIRLRHTLRVCDILLVINKIILNYIPLDKTDVNKVHFTSCGYDLAVLPTNNNSGVANNHGSDFIPLDKKIVGYFGTLSEDKGVNLILDLIHKVDDGYFFLIAGNGPLKHQVKQVAAHLPEKCKYLGRLTQMGVYQFTKLCDVTLALYRKDLKPGCPQRGSPMKVFESLAVGTPIIISEKTVNMLPKEVSELCMISRIELNDIIKKLEMTSSTKQVDMSSVVNVMRKYSWDYIAENSLVPLYKSILI